MSHPLNVDRHERLIAYDPCVVPWWEQRNVARLKLHFASVIHDDMEGVLRCDIEDGVPDSFLSLRSA
jgi:hypothetical protein